MPHGATTFIFTVRQLPSYESAVVETLDGGGIRGVIIFGL